MSGRRLIFLLLTLLIVSVVVFGMWYSAFFRSTLEPGETREVQIPKGDQSVPTTASAVSEMSNLQPQVEVVMTGLDTPWSLVFTSPHRILVTERPGRLRAIENGKLRSEPLQIFSEVSETGEEGLMSLALHPEYAVNHWLYVSLAYELEDQLWVKVMRYVDMGDRLTQPVTILDQIPAAKYHAGCALAFGPDGKLYITTGDATDRTLAQDLSSLAGKILRLNDDGSIPHDNPFGTAVWSYGHRNPQGMAWHPETDSMYSSEHGPSVFDGPAGGDEINLIEPGKNYGWPLVSHEKRQVGTEAPLIVYTPAEAPASLHFYSGQGNPAWKNNLFFGALRGEGLMRVVIDSSDSIAVLRSEKLDQVRFGRIRYVTEGPDGAIYFTTSNRDGRGEPASEDDRIFRLHFEP